MKVNFSYKYISIIVVLLVWIDVVHAQTFPLPYCSISFTTNTEPITLVKFAGINSSTTHIASPSTPQMENLTGIRGYVVPGENYQIIVKGNTDGDYITYITVYIDWNQDGMFGSGEDYLIGTITNSTGLDGIQLSSNIYVPNAPSVGRTRMRIVKNYNQYASGACGIYSYGQAEDYTITVLDDGCEL